MSLTLHTELDVDEGLDTEHQLDSEFKEETESNDAVDDNAVQPAVAVQSERISDSEDFRIKIWNAEMRCRGKEAIVEDLKEQLKFAKSDYDDAVAKLRKLAAEGSEPLPLFDSPAAAQEPTNHADEENDDSWKQRNFVEFIQGIGIDGLGKKKVESLADAVTTFGDFQDLRVRASDEGLHLSKLLPSGFGEKITDQIEQAFLDHQWSDSTTPVESAGDPEYEDVEEGNSEEIDINDL